jgi:hypothetical protein
MKMNKFQQAGEQTAGGMHCGSSHRSRVNQCLSFNGAFIQSLPTRCSLQPPKRLPCHVYVARISRHVEFRTPFRTLSQTFRSRKEMVNTVWMKLVSLNRALTYQRPLSRPWSRPISAMTLAVVRLVLSCNLLATLRQPLCCARPSLASLLPIERRKFEIERDLGYCHGDPSIQLAMDKRIKRYDLPCVPVTLFAKHFFFLTRPATLYIEPRGFISIVSGPASKRIILTKPSFCVPGKWPDEILRDVE